MSFAVIIPIGPKPLELDRARDVVESLNAYEPRGFTLFLVDDSIPGRPLADLIAPQLKERVVCLSNPRRGKGPGLGGGTAAAVLAGLRKASELASFDFVLKIDTDTLVIDQFSEKITARFKEVPHIGILGAYQFWPAVMQDRSSAPALEKLLRQVTLWRRTPSGGPALQLAFWGRYGRIRNIIRKAILNGYRLGEHCQGGGYAISRDCLDAMYKAGLLHEPTLWRRVPPGCDIVVAICAAAVGFGVQAFDGEGEPFGVKHVGLPSSPGVLIERGHSIVHSVKDCGNQREADVRAFFRQQRADVS